MYIYIYTQHSFAIVLICNCAHLQLASALTYALTVRTQFLRLRTHQKDAILEKRNISMVNLHKHDFARIGALPDHL